jgi:cobalt-zinc-cadmium efflux system protein
LAHQHAAHEAHGHSHDHGHAAQRYDLAFAVGIALNLVYVAAEAIFGLLAGSMALVADAGHNFSDVLGLALAWGAVWLGRRLPTPRRTYGFKRSTILASLANAVILLVSLGAILVEAIDRLITPAPVATGIVVWVAVVGVAVNLGTALLFMSGSKGDLNIRGAFLHMLADAGVTVGVTVAALVIGVTGWNRLDPLVSLAIVVIIFVGTWGLLRDAVNLSLDAVPSGIDRRAVEGYLAGLAGVREIHDLHIWAMSTTETALTAHLVRPGMPVDDALLEEARHELMHRFGIGHATLQVESGQGPTPCPQAPADVI